METKEIKGLVDPKLINTHMLAAARKGSCRSALTCLQMKHMDGRLHLATTDGRILLHTTINDNDMPDFDVLVKITRKLKGESDGDVEFTIKDGKVFFKGTDSFDAFEIQTNEKFPRYDEVEQPNKAKVPLIHHRVVDPKYLDIVLRYVGLERYAIPYVENDDASVSPLFYDYHDGNGMVKKVVLMTMRAM